MSLKPLELLLLKFPKTDSDSFWFLSWIGKTYAIGLEWKIRISFLNSTTKTSDLSKVLLSSQVSFEVNANYLSILETGMIFKADGKFLCYESNLDSITVYQADNYKPCSKPLFMNGGLDFIPPDDNLKDFNYYYYLTSSRGLNKVRVILPIQVVLNSFYFKSSSLTYNLLVRGIDSIFHDTTKIIKQNKVIGKLYYNNEIISYDDAKVLSKWMFVKNLDGYRALKLINSSIIDTLLKNTNKKRQSAYLNGVFPFKTASTLTLKGRIYKYKIDYYFLANDITDIKLEEDIFEVDEIELGPMFPSNIINNKSNSSFDKLKHTFNMSDLNSLKLSDKKANNYADSKIFLSEKKDIDIIDLPVFKVEQSNKEYDGLVRLNNTEILLDELSIDQKTGDSMSSAMSINIKNKKIIKNTVKFEKNDLIDHTVMILQERNNLSYLDRSSLFDPPRLNERLIQLKYKNTFYYLINIGIGNLGIIRNSDYTMISDFDLDVFVNYVYEEIKILPKRRKIWTKLRINPAKRISNIIVETSLRFQASEFASLEDAAIHMAKKVYQDRILINSAS